MIDPNDLNAGMVIHCCNREEWSELMMAIRERNPLAHNRAYDGHNDCVHIVMYRGVIDWMRSPRDYYEKGGFCITEFSDFCDDNATIDESDFDAFWCE